MSMGFRTLDLCPDGNTMHLLLPVRIERRALENILAWDKFHLQCNSWASHVTEMHYIQKMRRCRYTAAPKGHS